MDRLVSGSPAKRPFRSPGDVIEDLTGVLAGQGTGREEEALGGRTR